MPNCVVHGDKCYANIDKEMLQTFQRAIVKLVYATPVAKGSLPAISKSSYSFCFLSPSQ